MDIVGLLKNGFAAFNAWMRGVERNENEKAGINKMKVAQNEEFEENRKDAKDIGSRKHTSIRSSGVRRSPDTRKD